MPARSSLFLLLIFFSSLSDVRSGGLNHFRRNGQVPRKSFAHSSIVSSLTRSKIRAARQAQEDKGWDDGIYNERKSVVDDEDDVARILSMSDSLTASGQTKLIMNGKVIDGNRKPPLPPELTELPIPTRPDWRAITSKAMLDRAEHDEFMKWRKHLAALEDVYDVILTPFEKNPNYWRQLWRTVERSDVVVQVLDCRDPLFFRSSSLEKFVHLISSRSLHFKPEDAEEEEPSERRRWRSDAAPDPDDVVDDWKFEEETQGEDLMAKGVNESRVEEDGERHSRPKTNVLLLNKADLVPEEVRREWVKYFQQQKLPFFFFSAAPERDRDPAADGGKDEQNRHQEQEQEQEQEQKQKQEQEQAKNAEWQAQEGEHVILNATGLLVAFDAMAKDGAGNHQRLTVGFVGYPNVGKSSVINSLIAAGREEGDRRISVAHGPSPGKTKHLQTIFVRKNICLCDCPGIVFPSVINSKADLVCNGVLSIHTLRDVVEPLQLVCESVPRKVMERHCGLAIPTKLNTPVRARNAQDMVRAIRLERLGQQMICDTPANNQNEVYTADDLLRILCMRRKFYQQNSGNLDLRTGGIMILRDYIQGQLQHWKLPPGL